MPDWTISSATERDLASVLGLWQAAETLPTVSDTQEGLAMSFWEAAGYQRQQDRSRFVSS